MLTPSLIAQSGRRLFLATIAALAIASVAPAATYTFYDVDVNGDPYEWIYLSATGTATYANTFDIIGPGPGTGYNPSTMQVNTAVATFAFGDDASLRPGGSDPAEYVTINLGGTSWMSGVEVDGTIYVYDWVSASGSVTGLFLASLQDGILEYVVRVTSGDTYLKEAKLTAYASDKTTNVPDAGWTALMLGVAMFGLVAGRRRK